MKKSELLIVALVAVVLSGCLESKTETKPEKTGIIGKTTQDIGEYNPNAANQVVSDTKIRASDPITAPLSAYGPMTDKISRDHIAHAIALFNATEGRYPKDHDEFMERIIKENNIRLPVQPFGGKYVYDVEKHELYVVRSIENNEKAQQ
jgi:hypothetical protein